MWILPVHETTLIFEKQVPEIFEKQGLTDGKCRVKIITVVWEEKQTNKLGISEQ